MNSFDSETVLTAAVLQHETDVYTGMKCSQIVPHLKSMFSTTTEILKKTTVYKKQWITPVQDNYLHITM